MRDGYEVVMDLARTYPDLLQLVQACLEVHDAQLPYGGEFAGSWVLERAGVRWLPGGLRRLAQFSVLERVETSRRGHRAYYRLRDPYGVRMALGKMAT